MNEPSLQQISDYHTLSGQKRRIVMAVVLAGLILGSIYAGARAYFSNPSDAIVVKNDVVKLKY